MNLPSGWDSVRDVKPGILLWKKQFLQKKNPSGNLKASEKRQDPVILKDISLSEDERQTTQIGELDRVLGGGIVPGSLVLVGGDPGIGKSTCFTGVQKPGRKSGDSSLYFR